MRKLKVLILFVVLCLVLPSWAQQSYVNQGMGFSLKLPDGWEVQIDLKESVMLATSEKYPNSGLSLANVMVSSLENDENKEPEYFLNADLTRITPLVLAIEKGETIINDQNALWLKWEEESPMATHDTDMILKYYLMPNPEKIITLSFRGDKNYLNKNMDKVLEILNNFVFE